MGVFALPLPNIVITSDIATQDWERLKTPAWRSFKQTLEGRYKATAFENLPTIAGLSLGKPAHAPNDLLYIYPRITLYTLKP